MNFKISLALALFLMTSCSTHYIHKVDLIRQLESGGRKVYALECQNGFCLVTNGLAEFAIADNGRLDSTLKREPEKRALAWIDFAGLREIECRNRDGERVKIGLDHNSQLLVFDKKGEKTQFYFKTGREVGAVYPPQPRVPAVTSQPGWQRIWTWSRSVFRR